MKPSPAFEFPPEQDRALHRARRLEWLTLAFLATTSLVLYLVMGSSQAMKTAWVEDLLSFVPPIVFLVATRIAIWPPSKRFPYGYHRAISIAFLCAALALFMTGGWLLTHALLGLVRFEHPTIGGITLFGQTFWLGWLMLPALVWSTVPAVLLGRAKLPLASTMHDKVLHADALMNKADWLTALAAMVGVVGIGFGIWWADAAAAALISLDIMHDGYTNLREVVTNLMNETPKTVDRSQRDPLPDRVADHLRQIAWIDDAEVRMREEGHVYFGEAFVVVNDETDLPEKLYRATQNCIDLDWRLHDLVLIVVPAIETHARRPDDLEQSRPIG